MDPRVHPLHQVGAGRESGVTDRELRASAAQPTMTEHEVKPVSSEDPGIVGGEIVAIEEACVRVRLDTGSLGLAARASTADAEALHAGQRAMFRVLASDAEGTVTLAFADGENGPAVQEPFDRDVVRLHNALANHRPSSPVPVRSPERIHLGEEQIHSWIDSVDASLGRIRKNRAKRLNEEFYNS